MKGTEGEEEFQVRWSQSHIYLGEDEERGNAVTALSDLMHSPHIDS